MPDGAMIGSHAHDDRRVRSSGDTMCRKAAISASLLTAWVGVAGADPAPHQWSPSFYQAGTSFRTASGGHNSDFLLTCAPSPDDVRLRFVTDSFSFEAEGPVYPLDIDVDGKRFRIQGAVDAGDSEAAAPALLSGDIDPAIVAAITRGEELTLSLPAQGGEVSFRLNGAGAAIADMIGDCREFTPDWCAERLLVLGQPASADPSHLEDGHRAVVLQTLSSIDPSETVDADRALSNSCSAYYDLNNDGLDELLLYLRLHETMQFQFHVFAPIDGEFREVLQETSLSPRFVAWSFVPARWGGWHGLVTMDVEIADTAEPEARSILGHIYSWSADAGSYEIDWMHRTACRWPDCSM